MVEDQPIVPQDNAGDTAGEARKTFSIRTVIFNRTKSGAVWPFVSPEAVFLTGQPVPVYGAYQRLMGYAHIVPETKRVIALLNLDRQTPERLEIETRARPLWANAWFEALEYGDSSQGAKVLRVLRIEIATTPPFDPELPSLLEAVL